MRPVRSRLALERANCSFRYLCRYHELPACPPARLPAGLPARLPACTCHIQQTEVAYRQPACLPSHLPVGPPVRLPVHPLQHQLMLLLLLP